VRGEKSDNSKLLAFSGIHVIGPNAFPLFEEMPARFGIIDFYLKYCQQCAFLGYEKSDLRLLDVGKLDSLEQAETLIKQL
jgi:NDP-sugar pyrophosphorylase family protein